MLDHAAKYENELRLLLMDAGDDLRFQYAWNTSHRQLFELNKNTWDGRQFVSVRDGRVIGYLSYSIDRDSDVVYGVQIINFTLEPNITFSKDLAPFLRDVFMKYGHRKLRFTCIADNPIKPSYDRVCEKYGGRVVGVYRREERLLDGEYHDTVIYEILLDDFLRR